MAPRGLWKRPRCAIYNDNYRYGSSLYSPTIDDLEKRYIERIRARNAGNTGSEHNFDSLYGSSLPGSPSSDPGGFRSGLFSRDTDLMDLGSEIQYSLSTGRTYPGGPPPSQLIGLPPSGHKSHEPLGSVGRETRNGIGSMDLSSDIAEVEAASERKAKSRVKRSDIKMEPLEEEMSASSRRLRERGDSVRRRRERREGSQIREPNLNTTNAVDNCSQNLTMDRCRKIANEVDRLNVIILETETKVKSELTTVKNKLNGEIEELMGTLREQDRINQELTIALKRQDRQARDLKEQANESEEKYRNALSTITELQRKASQLSQDVDYVRGNLEKI